MPITTCDNPKLGFIKDFLALPRKRYFQDKLKSFIQEEPGDEGLPKVAPKDDVIFSLCAISDEFTQKLIYFLQDQGITLDSTDIPDLADAFLELMGEDKLVVGAQTYSIKQLVDWEDHIEMTLLEAKTIVLNGGKIAIDAANDLARTAVVNNLERRHQKDLIETFRQETWARIAVLTGIDAEQRTELLDRTSYYCDQVYPQSCKDYADPESCLELWLSLVSEYLAEHVADINAFMLDMDEHEAAVSRILMAHDGLISKHASAVQRYIHENSEMAPGETAAQLRRTLIQFWFYKYMEDQADPVEDMPDEQGTEPEVDPADMN